MNSPIKDLAMKVIEAGDDLIRFRAEASTTARDYAENAGWFSNQKVQKHEAFMAGAKWGLEKGLSANHADQLARACVVMEEALKETSITINALVLVAEKAHMSMPEQKLVSIATSDLRALRELGKVIHQCLERNTKNGEAIDQANKICAGRE